METISNLATTAATTASKLIYGEQPAATNETAAKEPLSGEQGKGTPTDPFDHGNLATPSTTTENKATFLDYGNSEAAGREPLSGKPGSDPTAAQSSSTSNDDFLKLNPTLDGPQVDSKSPSSGEPTIYTSRDNATYTGMPIVPLNPDVATSGPTTSSGAGTTVASPDPAIKTAPPDSVTAASNTYGSDPTKGIATKESTQNTAAQPTPHRDGTPAWTDTGVPSKVGPSSTSDAGAPKGVQVAEEKHGRKSATGESPEIPASPDSEEKSGKMSHLKEKLKDKLHIGSKEK